MVRALLLLLVVAGLVTAAAAAPSRAVAAPPAMRGLTGESLVLCERWFQRSRRFRLTGGIVAVVVGVAVATIRAVESDVPFELNAVELLAWGIGGSLAGSVLAEAFRLGRPRGLRVASLQERTADDYRDEVADRRERIVLAVSGAAVVVGLVTGAPATELVVWAGAILVLGVARRWLGWRVALRPRPDVAPDLERADDELRRMAVASGLGRPIVTLSVLAAARQWAVLHDHHQHWVLAVVAMAGWATGVVWWWQNRDVGAPRRWALGGRR